MLKGSDQVILMSLHEAHAHLAFLKDLGLNLEEEQCATFTTFKGGKVISQQTTPTEKWLETKLAGELLIA